MKKVTRLLTFTARRRRGLCPGPCPQPPVSLASNWHGASEVQARSSRLLLRVTLEDSLRASTEALPRSPARETPARTGDGSRCHLLRCWTAGRREGRQGGCAGAAAESSVQPPPGSAQPSPASAGPPAAASQAPARTAPLLGAPASALPSACGPVPSWLGLRCSPGGVLLTLLPAPPSLQSCSARAGRVRLLPSPPGPRPPQLHPGVSPRLAAWDGRWTDGHVADPLRSAPGVSLGVSR